MFMWHIKLAGPCRIVATAIAPKGRHHFYFMNFYYDICFYFFVGSLSFLSFSQSCQLALAACCSKQ